MLKSPLCEKCPYSDFSGPYFPAFGLNKERYGVSLRIQSEYGKIRTRRTPNTDTSRSAMISGDLQNAAENNQKAIQMYAHAIASKSLDHKSHFRLGLIMHEAFYATDIYGMEAKV